MHKEVETTVIWRSERPTKGITPMKLTYQGEARNKHEPEVWDKI